jgi:hypothetical protein
MSPSATTRFVRARWPHGLLGGLLTSALAFAPSAFASTPTVNLGHAAGYAIISGASVANTGNSTVRGDIGAPATASGFPPGVLDGTMQVGSVETAAYNDFLTAYNEVQSRTGGSALPPLAGATLTPGLYTATAAAGMAASTVLTLNGGGNANAVFVIQVNGALALGAGAQVLLTGGAQASNVFWQVTGAFSVGAAPAVFVGTVMASTTGAIGAGALINGRVFAETAVTTNDDDFYSSPPTITLTGGSAKDINNSSPTISGTTNVGSSGVVTVTVDGQTLTTAPALDGSWAVTPTILANGSYPVLASTTDGAGNVGSAAQQLTIDTVPPLITLNGAPAVLSDSATPVIAGTTDAAPGTIVTVEVEAQTLTAVVNGTTIVQSVGAQTLAAVVQSNGTWNVSPGVPMGEGVRTVTASVTDRAGNTSTATEQLNVETIAPVAPSPTAPVTTPLAPTPTGPTAPVSTQEPIPAPPPPTRLSLSSHTLTALHPIKASFTLTKPGTVQLKLAEIVHGKAKTIGTVILKGQKAGKGSYTLSLHFAGHKLGKGNYQLAVQTTSGKFHSKPLTQKLSVR